MRLSRVEPQARKQRPHNFKSETRKRAQQTLGFWLGVRVADGSFGSERELERAGYDVQALELAAKVECCWGKTLHRPRF